MRTKYWRFAYDEEMLKQIITHCDLVFPELSKWPMAKNNNKEKLISEIKEGHFILLANFNLNNEIGTVKCVGRIVKNDQSGLIVQWKMPIPSWNLTPNAQGGVQEWRKEGVFCFEVEPAKRYKLPTLTSKLFKMA